MPPSIHYQRLQLQKQLRITYLIACVEQVPVGHTVISWDGPSLDEPRKHIRVPTVEDVYVLSEWRNQGIATRMLTTCEEYIHKKGLAQLGLAVSIDNTAALKLYEKAGYQHVQEIPIFYDVQADGSTLTQCIFMMKNLNPSMTTI